MISFPEFCSGTKMASYCWSDNTEDWIYNIGDFLECDSVFLNLCRLGFVASIWVLRQYPNSFQHSVLPMRRLSRIASPLWRPLCDAVWILLRFLHHSKDQGRVCWHGFRWNLEELLHSWVTRMQSNLRLWINSTSCNWSWWKTAGMWRNLLPNRRVQWAR